MSDPRHFVTSLNVMVRHPRKLLNVVKPPKVSLNNAQLNKGAQLAVCVKFVKHTLYVFMTMSHIYTLSIALYQHFFFFFLAVSNLGKWIDILLTLFF